jgi:hypothetical protein
MALAFQVKTGVLNLGYVWNFMGYDIFSSVIDFNKNATENILGFPFSDWGVSEHWMVGW